MLLVGEREPGKVKEVADKFYAGTAGATAIKSTTRKAKNKKNKIIILETKMDDIFKELVGLAQWHGGTLCGVCRPNILPLSLVGRGQASFFATLLRTLLHAFPL